MNDTDLRKRAGRNYTIGHFGRFAEMPERHVIKIPNLPRPVTGKVFLREPLGFTGMEISLNNMRPGESVPFLHLHETHEEAYIFVKGRGQIQVDGEILDVEEGTVVRIATPGVRTWRNNGTEDLYFVVVQAKENSFAPDERDGRLAPDPPRW